MTRRIITTTITAIAAATLLFAAGAQQADPPALPQDPPLPTFDEAMVRFVHVSPNAGPVEVSLATADDGVAERHVVALDYLETTEYQSVREGSFEVLVRTAARDGEAVVLAEQVHTARGGHYTIALLGLVLDDVEAETADDEGFLAWLQGLFTPDRPELALRALVLDDVGVAGVGPSDTAFRVVHAAPGTDTLAFVHVHDDGADTLASVSYGESTGAIDVLPETGSFELRAEGADTTIAEVTGVEHEPGRINTVFMVGTPIEEVPLETIVVSTDWALVGALAPGASGVGVTGVMTGPELVTLRELAFELGARIELAEQRLSELGDVGDDQALDEAQRELDGATRLLEQLHLVLDSAEQRAP